MQKPKIGLETYESECESPVAAGGPGARSHRIIGNPGRLTRLGAHPQTQPPGSRSSFRQGLEARDEPTAGEAAARPAGHPVGHRRDIRPGAPAAWPDAGARGHIGIRRHPDPDLVAVKAGAARRCLHGDGRPRGERPA